MATQRNLQTLNRLLRELRYANSQAKNPGKLQDGLAYKYAMDMYKRYQDTPAMYCKGTNEMEHLANTYTCYLHSVRKAQELTAQYKGEGERSVESSAKLVGLELPPEHELPFSYSDKTPPDN